MKKSKLKFEKFQIMTLNNLSDIKGGTATTIGFTSGDSENTTFTTDPNIVCPSDTDPTGQISTSMCNTGGGI